MKRANFWRFRATITILILTSVSYAGCEYFTQLLRSATFTDTSTIHKLVVHGDWQPKIPLPPALIDHIAMDSYLGPREGFLSYHETWLRDYYPLVREGLVADRVVPVAISYLNPHSLTGRPISFREGGEIAVKPGELISHRFGTKLFTAYPSRFSGFLEGSNVIVTQGTQPFLITSEKTVEWNQRSLDMILKEARHDISEHYQYDEVAAKVRLWRESFHSSMGEWKPKNRTQVRHELADAFGVFRSRVIILPGMPGEMTKNVDAWMGELPGNRVAVQRIPDYFDDEIKDRRLKILCERVNDWLDIQAEHLAELGVEVVRVPVFPPKNLSNFRGVKDQQVADWHPFVQWVESKGNWYVPVYREEIAEWGPLGERVLADLKKALLPAGIAENQIQFVDLDGFTQRDGSLRCFTGQCRLPILPMQSADPS